MDEQETGDSDSDADVGFADLQSVKDLRQHLCHAAQTETADKRTERCDGEYDENSVAAYTEETQSTMADAETDFKAEMQCRTCGGELTSSLEPPNEEARARSDRRRGHRSKKVWTSLVCNNCSNVTNVTCRTLKRLWCSFQLNMNHPSFALVPKLLGRGGCNVKSIFEETGAKVRVRGRGSGHGEFLTGKEANIPLMVAVSSEGDDAAGFERALELTLELLRGVEQRYIQHCSANNHQDNQKPFSIGPPVNDRKDFRNLTSKQLSKKLAREIIARCQPVEGRSDRSYEGSIAEDPSSEHNGRATSEFHEHGNCEEPDPSHLLQMLRNENSASSTDDRIHRPEYGRNERSAEHYSVTGSSYAPGGPVRGAGSRNKHNSNYEWSSPAVSLGLLHGTSSAYSAPARPPYANRTNSQYYDSFESDSMSQTSLYRYPYSQVSGGYSRPSAR